MTRRLLSLVALLCLAPAAEGSSPPELIARLKALPLDREQGASRELYDLHGNAHELLQALMKQRFAATGPICDELANNSLAKPIAAALYDVLAFTKDPAAIEWLERHWDKNTSLIHEAWLNERWETYTRGASHEDSKWLTQPDAWAAFFRRRIAAEQNNVRRVRLQRVLAGWFHDDETIAFFRKLEQSRPSAEELLCAQLYLKQHKQPYDSAQLQDAIESLRRSREGRKVLLDYAGELRDAAFVPWLITVAAPAERKIEVKSPRWVLQAITFRSDVEWKRWFNSHRGDSRQAWLAAAIAEFNETLASAPDQARSQLEKRVYFWNDREILPYVPHWAEQLHLANEVIGWVNLSYHPFWRDELRAVAERVLEKHHAELGPSALDLLRGLDFLPRDDTWDDYVTSTNSRL